LYRHNGAKGAHLLHHYDDTRVSFMET
jgi:hypothetical protein